ncbi:Protein CL16A [Desmophyllum pertusum]|uniref:Protein CL16A n=1 Tax=Desmophyllum pertusum TaxID=174260 RepID=A0A9W9Z2N3_9CNID|nr:Protein CL16A [Desmophyllum pertusum]
MKFFLDMFEDELSANEGEAAQWAAFDDGCHATPSTHGDTADRYRVLQAPAVRRSGAHSKGYSCVPAYERPLPGVTGPDGTATSSIKNNSDLIACTVKTEDKQQRRFLVIDEAQFILVEPDTTKLGWGVVKFVARLSGCGDSP